MSHPDDPTCPTSACDECKAEQHALMLECQRKLKQWCVFHRTPYYGECLLCLTADIKSLLHHIFTQLLMTGAGGVVVSTTEAEPITTPEIIGP